jgi:hypothetical protein
MFAGRQVISWHDKTDRKDKGKKRTNIGSWLGF